MKWFRELYNWCLDVAGKSFALPLLGFISFIESIFFPLPTDAFLIGVLLAQRKRAFTIWWVTTLTSVAGGVVAYWIGAGAMDTIGTPIIAALHMQQAAETIGKLYVEYDFWAVFAAGFTPLPYKVFTLTAGGFGVALFPFVTASIVSRGLRYAIEAVAIYKYGDAAKEWLERNFNKVGWAGLIIVAIGVAFKVIGGS